MEKAVVSVAVLDKKIDGRFRNKEEGKNRGKFISIEGSDGSGKSTQLEYIKEYFINKKIETMFTREPGGTSIGEKIREIILDVENIEMDPMTEAFLYASSRAQHVREKIVPALEQGVTVICDRFVDSSIAYQQFGRELGEEVSVINKIAVGGCMPDYTIFLDLHPDEGRNRVKNRNESMDRLEIEKHDFHLKVYSAYKEIIDEDKDRFIVIDASGTPEEVRDLVYCELDKIFEEI